MTLFRTKGDDRWFPGDPEILRHTIESCMSSAVSDDWGTAPLIAGIAPHAGYAYSGGVCGYTFRALQEAAVRQQGPDLVVVLGFSHRIAFDGVAWLDAEAIRSPLGDIRVDGTFVKQMVASMPNGFLDTRLHDGEHSAENQIPFVQVALPDVPVAVGLIGSQSGQWPRGLGEQLLKGAGKRRIVVLASTDLLHDPDYDRVCATDSRTLALMEKLDSGALHKAWSYQSQNCCGIGPVLCALDVAKQVGCRQGRLLCYRNSGDIDPSGLGQWVVGYGAMVFEYAS